MRVIKYLAIFVGIVGLVLGFSITTGAAQTQSPDAVFVAETGHWIRGDFFQFYQNLHDPLLVLGYPITDELVDPVNGVRVQYFQRARLDLVEAEESKQVKIAPLGDLLYKEGNPQVQVPVINPSCRIFQSSGKRVCYAFKQFYEAHEGELYFGAPISDMEMQGSLIVQYFERARMEWHPQQPPGQRVVLSDLGRIYFDGRVGDQTLLRPSSGANLISTSGKNHVHAFVDKSLVSSNSQNSLFVIVHDQFSSPARGANVAVTFIFPDGHKNTFRPQPVNLDGISRLDFSIGEMPPNQVVRIKVEVQYLDQDISTSSWFRTWW